LILLLFLTALVFAHASAHVGRHDHPGVLKTPAPPREEQGASFRLEAARWDRLPVGVHALYWRRAMQDESGAAQGPLSYAGWYGPHLERLHEDAALREADLAQLAQIASTYPNRERFLTELTLDPPSATSDQAGLPLNEDYLILSTIHSAKGQEWTTSSSTLSTAVCPSDLATGSTPEIEEERRLLYLAMTRAKDQLHVMVPQRFYAHGQRSNGDRHVYAQRSRFIPSTILAHFDLCSWPTVKLTRNLDGKTSIAAVDVRARMRRMWS
jgi:DNA helicase-2/ATP-dependent DNA helicase PcrA